MKKLFSFISMILAVLLTAASLVSCYDNREIDETAYVIALGTDRAEDGFLYTFQISSPLAIGGGDESGMSGGGEENSTVENIVIGAKSFTEAKSYLNNFLSKTLNFSHLEMIVFSEEVAKESLKSHIGFLKKEREIRPSTYVSVSRCSAEEFLKGINPALEANTAKFYERIAKNGSLFAPHKKLGDFLDEEAEFASAVPLGVISEAKNSGDYDGESDEFRISSSKSGFSGLVLIKNFKETGTLSAEQGALCGLLGGTRKSAEFEIPLKDRKYPVRIKAKKMPKFTAQKRESGAFSVEMKAEFEAELMLTASEISEGDIERFLKKEICEVFFVTQKAGADIFKSGNSLRRKCKTVSAWRRLSWDKAYESALFSPDIKVEITR